MKVHSSNDDNVACEFCGMSFTSLAKVNDHIKK